MSRIILEHITEAVVQAGFYATSPEEMGEWERITLVGERCSTTSRLTGNSFWVTIVERRWFIGTWSGIVYEIESVQKLIDFSVAFLSHNPRETFADVPAKFIHEYGLRDATDSFQRLVA